MNMNKLYKMQNILDERIIIQHGLEETNIIPNLFLGFKVELAELANATRCFKHWSIKPAQEKEVILEEYVDGLHFVLSLGNHFGFTKLETGAFWDGDPVSSINDCYIAACNLEEETTLTNYENLVATFLNLSRVLGFSLEEVEKAYYDKNEVNHLRQEKGY